MVFNLATISQGTDIMPFMQDMRNMAWKDLWQKFVSDFL